MEPKHCSYQAFPAISRSLEGREEERLLVERLIASMDRPGAVISEVAAGTKFVGLRARDGSGERIGLASLLGAVPGEEDKRLAADLPGVTVGEAAQLLLSDNAFKISLGAAALNAGLTPPQGQPSLDAASVMAEKTGSGEAVLVGDFPFTSRLKEQVGTLHLFELRPGPDCTPPEQWDGALARCKVLGLTGTTLLTRMLAEYLRKAPQAFTVIIGPTTPLSPALFDAGADVLAGCHVFDPDPVFEGIRQGLSFQMFKKRGVAFVAWARDSRKQR